jgi:N-methylhydantoinase A/oxoprolinase/acetone carboxylase beta subunit
MRVRANIDNGGIVPLFPRRDSEPAMPPVQSNDLTQCFTEALTRVSRELFGEEDLASFLLHQGATESDIRVHVEFELQYGDRLTKTAVVSPFRHLHSAAQLMELVALFGDRCARRFGDEGQAAGRCDHVRIIRAVSSVEHRRTDLKPALPDTNEPAGPAAGCIYPFTLIEGRLPARIYDHGTMTEGTTVEGPALVESARTTYLVESGWTLTAGRMGSAWLTQTGCDAAPASVIAATPTSLIAATA